MGKKLMPLRVVIDTNGLVSALLFGGRPGVLRDLWKSGRVVPLVSKPTFVEFRRVLSYPKFKLSRREISTIINDEILPFVEVVEVAEKPARGCRDPHDDKFLAVASSGGAGYLVTGDQDLLVLGSLGNCKIVTPGEFMLMFE